MFTQAVVDNAHRHALKRYPEECCGVVVQGNYFELINMSDDPENTFKIGMSQAEIEEFAGGILEAVIHSHPDGTASPSSHDMISQIESAVPWGVFSTDGKECTGISWFGDECPIQPLLGRPFIHGVYDCFGLVRDYYRLKKNITIPQFPRDEEWWYNGGDLLNVENFKDAGFRVIPQNELQIGDVVAATILCNTVNHVGIYVGKGLVLHHLYDRLSKRDPIGRWLKYCKYCLRYEG